MFPLSLPSLTFRPLRYRYRGVADWSGHIPFACDLVSTLKPAVFVELGVHYGESYFAFCQAIQESGHPCRAFGIDTWRGDMHTGRYGDEVLADADGHNQRHYQSFSTLLRTTFDEAAQRFGDAHIDLLHIDGLHTYDAVRHDFETWLPKLKPGAVVLLHDIAMRRHDFGVWRFWSELERQYPSFAFAHSCGLGIVQLPGGPPPSCLLEILFRDDEPLRAQVRQYYQLCAECLDGRHAARSAGQHDTNNQVFWRAGGEEFCELRSAKVAHTLTGEPATVRIPLPPLNPAPAELRIDFTDKRMVLRVIDIAITTPNGSKVWSCGGWELCAQAPYSGMQVIPGSGEEAVAIVTGEDCSLLLPCRPDWRPALGEGAAIELGLSVAGAEATLEMVAAKYAGCLSELQAPGASSQPAGAPGVQPELSPGSLAIEREAQLRDCEAALAEARQLLQAGTSREQALQLALEHAQVLVRERDEHLREYGRALAEAQGLVRERDESLAEYDRALAEAQRLATDRQQALTVLDGALTHAQALVRDCDERLARYDRALAEAQQVAAERLQAFTAVEAALAETQALVHERDQRLAVYQRALAEARNLLFDREHDIDVTKLKIAEQEARLWEYEHDVHALHGTLETLEAALQSSKSETQRIRSQLLEIQDSLLWRLTAPLRKSVQQ
jgi:hypothetical protein